jgi:CRP/FNR family transcriptional regulator
MAVGLEALPHMTSHPGALLSCADCAARRLKLCAGLRMDEGKLADVAPDNPTLQMMPARRTIYSAREWPDYIYAICQGWATTSLALPDGRKQILSVLLPGNVESPLNMFEPRIARTLETVTDVLYRRFRRETVRERLVSSSDAIDAIGKIWSEEHEQSDQLAVDLGRRTADERVARQIISLVGRLQRRGMMQDRTIEFPLRQRQIADITGLTPVHVSRVLSEFQRKKLIQLEERQLTIVDIDGLRRIAEWR